MWGAALGATKPCSRPTRTRCAAGIGWWPSRGVGTAALQAGSAFVGVSYVDGGMWLPHRRRRWFSTPGPQEGTDGSPQDAACGEDSAPASGRVPAAQMDDPDVLHKALDAVLSDEGAAYLVPLYVGDDGGHDHRVSRWLKSEGDVVAPDEAVCEIETTEFLYDLVPMKKDI